jgi:hypothetical protein
VPTRWEAFDLFDEEEQERRRKKGKELVPVEPMRTRPPPWTGNDAGYGPAAFGPAAFGPTGNPSWPALPPAQGEPIPPLPPRAEMRYDPTKLSQPVHHPHQWPGLDRHYGYHIPQSEIRLNRQVDGILTPSSGDLTVQLTMDLQEDLGDQLDELARLSRLGHFLSAQDYFNENLQHHMANPYVFVQYADMLLRQGNFQGIRLIKSTPMDKHDEEISNSDGQMTPPTNKEMRTLHANWELIQLLAKSHTLGLLSGVPDVFAEAVDVLYDPGMTNEPSVSSTEVRVVLPYDEVRITNRQIQILGLTLHLTSHPALNLKWLEHGGRALDAFPTSLSRLYPTLLRQGRIWDFHDLVVLLPTIEDVKALTHDIFRKEFIPSLETMVSDWSDSVHGYDSSTTMALLSILTHIILSPIQASEHECIAVFKLCLPLAISVMENDPANLRSRPYLRLLLAKSRFAETASRRAIDTLASHLQSSPGVCYSPEIALLPLYVPSGDEIPEWTPSDQSSELKDPVRLVLRSATELGDYETEVMAHQELIRLSSDPRDDLDRLCDLQLSRQGDLNGFSLSLASKYFVATTQQAREELSTSISHLLPKVVSTHYWDPSRKWILNMILYKLEGRSPMRIRRILERSGSDYQGMDKSLLREISRKMPILKDWANSQVGSGSKTERKATVLQAGHVSPPVYKPPARRAKNTTSMRTAERPHAPTQQRTANEPAKERDTPLTTASIPRDNLQDRHVQHQPSPPLVSGPVLTGESSSMVIQVDKTHEEDARRVAKIKAEVEAEFNRKIEDEEVSERKRREERMAVLEGLKKGA